MESRLVAGEPNPAEARQARIAGYRRLPAAELERVLGEQARRRDAARIEEKAIIARWADVRKTFETLSISTGEIEQVLLERRRRSG